MLRKIIAAILLSAMLAGAGCAAKPDLAQAPKVVSMSAALDPDPAVRGDPNPYARCHKDILGAFSPDRELFNRLYRAVENLETAVDISAFGASAFQKTRTCESIYALSNTVLFYVKKLDVSKDGKKVTIAYRETPERIRADQLAYYGLQSFIIHNIALEEYSQLQKFFAVYQYIAANSVYTDDMNDETTFSAFSVLVRHKGICFGYATLGEILFGGAGIPSRVAQNEAHAWNIVTIGGRNYHTDPTWGAGNGFYDKSFRFILMDDALRQRTLEENGFAKGRIHLGYYAGYAENNESVPVCSDARFDALNKLPYQLYAPDVPGGWIYYGEAGMIKRMKLDGSGKEDVLPAAPAYLAFFDGWLYYVEGERSRLHKFKPGGGDPVGIDTPPIAVMELKGGGLLCKFNDPDIPDRALPLIAFESSDYENAKAVSFPDAAVPGGRSFCLRVKFSAPMKAAVPEDGLRFVGDDGVALPVRYRWSSDGKTLTIRPQAYWGDLASAKLYLKGLRAKNGAALGDIVQMKAAFGP